MIKTEQQTIECPNCGSRELATVRFTFPFNTFIHDCRKCRYTIMESEWVLVDTQDEVDLKNSNPEDDE